MTELVVCNNCGDLCNPEMIGAPVRYSYCGRCEGRSMTAEEAIKEAEEKLFNNVTIKENEIVISRQVLNLLTKLTKAYMAMIISEL